MERIHKQGILLGIITIVILSIYLVGATLVSVVLEAPSDEKIIHDDTIEFQFRATTDTSPPSPTTTACKLYVDGIIEAFNNTVIVDESTFLEVSNLDDGIRKWYVKCDDVESARNEVYIVTFCKYGEVGELEIDINDPDNDDDFDVGDIIKIEVDIENNGDDDLDVVVEAELYDLDDEDSIVDDEIELELDDGEDETVDLELRIPSNIDEDNTFVINVKVYEDGDQDDHCAEESVKIDIDKQKHSVIIEEFSISPTPISCGDTFRLSLELANAGKDDESVKIHIFNEALGIDTQKTVSIDEGDDYSTEFMLNVPTNINEGLYPIDIYVYFDKSGSDYDESVRERPLLEVKGNCLGVEEEGEEDLTLVASQFGDAFANSDFVIKAVATNTGNVTTEYEFGAAEYASWASLVKIEPETLTLSSGAEGTVYLTFRPLPNIAGTHTLTVTANFDSTTKEDEVTVNIKLPSVPAPKVSQFWFEMKYNWYWVLINLILLIALIVIIAYLVKHKRGRGYREYRGMRYEPVEIYKPKRGKRK